MIAIAFPILLAIAISVLTHRFLIERKTTLINKVFSPYTLLSLLLYIVISASLATAAEKIYRPTKTVILTSLGSKTTGENIWYISLFRKGRIPDPELYLNPELYLIYAPKETHAYQVYDARDVTINFDPEKQPILQEETAVAFKNKVYDTLFPRLFLKLDEKRYTLTIPPVKQKELT